MQLLKLTEEQLKNISSGITLQRAENYVGKFYECEIEGNRLRGKIKGNHGVYNVELIIDSDPLNFTCDCSSSKEMFCKHAAALGLTYIYTPWVFTTEEEFDRNKISTTGELQFYLKSVKLKDLVDELKRCCIGVSSLADLTGISLQQLSMIIKDDQNGKNHTLTLPLKLSCLYLIERGVEAE